jgi:hypothetical protein
MLQSTQLLKHIGSQKQRFVDKTNTLLLIIRQLGWCGVEIDKVSNLR